MGIVSWSNQHLSFLYSHAFFPDCFPVGKQLQEIIHHPCKVIDAKNLIHSLSWAMLPRQVYLEVLYWTGWYFRMIFFDLNNVNHFFSSSGEHIFLLLKKGNKSTYLKSTLYLEGVWSSPCSRAPLEWFCWKISLKNCRKGPSKNKDKSKVHFQDLVSWEPPFTQYGDLFISSVLIKSLFQFKWSIFVFMVLCQSSQLVRISAYWSGADFVLILLVLFHTYF